MSKIFAIGFLLTLILIMSFAEARFNPTARTEPYSCIEDELFKTCVYQATDAWANITNYNNYTVYNITNYNAEDIWVNESGDIMTGNLMIWDAVNLFAISTFGQIYWENKYYNESLLAFNLDIEPSGTVVIDDRVSYDENIKSQTNNDDFFESFIDQDIEFDWSGIGIGESTSLNYTIWDLYLTETTGAGTRNLEFNGLDWLIDMDAHGYFAKWDTKGEGVANIYRFALNGSTYMLGDLEIGGNLSNPSGTVIWSNGTVETGAVAGGYSGVADVWVNETGDTMTGTLNVSNAIWLYPNGTGYFDIIRVKHIYGHSPIHIHNQVDLKDNVTLVDNKTQWAGNATNWWGKMYSDIFRGITGIFDNLIVGNYTAVNGDVVVWENGTVEVVGTTDTTCVGNGTCHDIIYSSNITGYNCPAGFYMMGRWVNGTARCRADIDTDTIYTGVADVWVNETGDVMTGDLHLNTGLWVNVSNCDTLDTDREGYVHCGTDDGGVAYDGVADVWVNETGDVMTGDLNITDGDYYFNVTSTGALSSEVGSGRVAELGSKCSATGNLSFAVGYDATASGGVSFAMGSGATASGLGTIAMGYGATASGGNSISLGYYATASNPYSIAMGYHTTASGFYSTAIGYNASALNEYSVAMGRDTTASGSHSTVMGRDTVASGSYSTAIGYDTTASGILSTAMGYGIGVSGDYSVGFGGQSTSDTITDNNMFALKNLNFTVGSDVVIWENGTVEIGSSGGSYSGVADVWVNETGDVMTGDLNISAWLNVDGEIRTETLNISEDDALLYIDTGGNITWDIDECSHTLMSMDIYQAPVGSLTANDKMQTSEQTILYDAYTSIEETFWDIDVSFDWSVLGEYEDSGYEYKFIDLDATDINGAGRSSPYIDIKLLDFELYDSPGAEPGVNYFAYWTNDNASKFSVKADGDTYIDKILRVTDYGAFSGGVHVGGTSDPGTDNLVVDGTSTLVGNVNITSGRYEAAKSQPKFRAYSSGGMTNLVNAAWTKVNLAAESYDPLNKFNVGTYRYTPTVAGYYTITGQVYWSTGLASGKRGMVAIYKNGVASALGSCHFSATTYATCGVNDIFYLDTNDYIELYARSLTSTNTADIAGGSSNTYMAAHMIS